MVLHKFIWHIASKIPGSTAYLSVTKYILLIVKRYDLSWLIFDLFIETFQHIPNSKLLRKKLI